MKDYERKVKYMHFFFDAVASMQKSANWFEKKKARQMKWKNNKCRGKNLTNTAFVSSLICLMIFTFFWKVSKKQHRRMTENAVLKPSDSFFIIEQEQNKKKNHEKQQKHIINVVQKQNLFVWFLFEWKHCFLVMLSGNWAVTLEKVHYSWVS